VEKGHRRVHQKSGTIVVQLCTPPSLSHELPKRRPGARGPFRYSRPTPKTFVARQGFVDASTPRALRLDEIPYRRRLPLCVDRAIEAGFDGVELHGAHGYLLDAFLRDGTNKRTDAYGGCIENRSRLLLEVAKSCADAIGANRLGVRISPYPPLGDSARQRSAGASSITSSKP